MSDIYAELVKKHGLSSAQKKIIEIVDSYKIILEVGSSHGYLTKEFKAKGCTIDIIEKNLKAVASAKKYARQTYIGSAEELHFLKKIKNQYDLIIFADVLEHLVSPEIPIKFCKKILKPNGKIIISLPNIASWPARKELFFLGKFEYTDSGLMDKTHLRFYSLNSFKKFLQVNQIKIESIIPCETYLPLQRTLSKLPLIGASVFLPLFRFLAEQVPNLAYFHYIVVAKYDKE